MVKIITDKEKIDELLTRGVAEVINKEHLRNLLLSGKRLRIKLGIDPTSSHIHIGRAVVLWKLRAFQELGHEVIFIVGDATGVIGDTSDKEAERPMLSEKEVKKNAKTYLDQAFKIIDKKKTETHYNSEWLSQLGFLELAKIANLFGLHEFEARENISRRMRAGKRVSYHELMYPLMQGYDSVAVKADVELGGTDQRFNLLTGREIQRAYSQAPQDILMTELLEGSDGRKMSSSWGNVINITDEPGDMFGKVMSIGDEFMKRYFLLATDVSLQNISLMLKKGPRDAKFALAGEVVARYYGEKKAEQAKREFENTFSKGIKPTEIERMAIRKKEIGLIDLLVETKMASSKSEARRLIEQGAVRIDDKKKIDVSELISLEKEILLQVGPRRFIRITSS